MTGDHAAAPRPAPASAHELLYPALLELIDAVRVASRRVVAGGPGLGAEGAPRGARPGAPNVKPAFGALDVEAVHDFRVALRRLRTLLRPARAVYGRKRLRALSVELKVFAGATSALRDEEVLRETLADLELAPDVRSSVEAWVARRGRKERSCRAEVVRLLSAGRARRPGRAAGPAAPADLPELEPSLTRLAARVRRPKRRQRGAEELGREALEAALAEVRALASADPADGRAMHELRIRFKRLRYSAEAFAPLLGERASRAAKSAARMQKRLGQLHDIDEAMVRMGRAWGLRASERAAVLEALAAERARIAAKAAAELDQELTALAAAWPPRPASDCGA